MEKVLKFFNTVSKAVDIETGIFEAMITTEAVDRQGDIVRATGAKLDNYLKNPVVLWAHNYDQPPVARALSIEVIPGNGLKAVFQFPEAGVNPQADIVRRLWAAGFLNATSIGFIPLDSKNINDVPGESWYAPQDYVSWEMLEFSIVPVPANQEALRLAAKNMKEQILKSGWVLSSANEKKIKSAVEALNSVLESLDQQEPVNNSQETPETAGDTEPQESTEQTTTENAEHLAEVEEKAANLIRSLLEKLF